MIDVDTYRSLPQEDQREIDLWLEAWLHPHHKLCTQIEMVDESGTCRVRHERIEKGPPLRPVIVHPGEIATADRIVNGQPTPNAIIALAPGSGPPPQAMIDRWWRTRVVSSPPHPTT